MKWMMTAVWIMTRTYSFSVTEPLADSEKTAHILLWMDNWYSGFSGQSAVLYTYMTLIFREMNYIYLRKTETKRFCRKRGHFFRMNDLKYPDNYLSDKIIFPLLVTTAW